MASKYGVAWKKYKKALSKSGDNLEAFPNPDESHDKSFISTGVSKMWEDKEKKPKPVSKKKKKKPDKKNLRTNAVNKQLLRSLSKKEVESLQD